MATSRGLSGDPLFVLTERAEIGRRFTFTLWTNDPSTATAADAAGVDRIGIDLERLGKHERQRGRATWISDHSVEDLELIACDLRFARAFARTEPVHAQLGDQVDRVIRAGAEVLMLPMFRGPEEVERFVALVAGRAAVVLLLETREAVGRLDSILAVDGVDEVHVGLNDLAIAVGASNRFLLLTSELMDEIASAVLSAGRRFAVGGLGRYDDRGLPIRPDLVYAQVARLGAQGALLARSFSASPSELAPAVARARRRVDFWFSRGGGDLEKARAELAAVAGAAAEW